jgi:hypothetical protein
MEGHLKSSSTSKAGKSPYDVVVRLVKGNAEILFL